MVELFDQDEDGYLAWIAANQNGYVATIDRGQHFQQYPMVHAATHKLISSQKIGGFTTGDYVKFCSNSLSQLEAYASRHFGRDLTRCATCMR